MNAAPPWAVHPHARGEHPYISRSTAVSSGSSPRPWGTLRHRGRRRRHLRFIPTPVGNTQREPGRTVRCPVHPHARGEHERRCCAGRLLRGSSPRPWGTRTRLCRAEFERRFIPTPVGNTTCRVRRGMTKSVHPHARGEHFVDAGLDVRPDGSSPRPWGTPPKDPPNGRSQRFIPTPVGNTSFISAMKDLAPVHPHARGEHTGLITREWSRYGSSPRPWGTQQAPA